MKTYGAWRRLRNKKTNPIYNQENNAIVHMSVGTKNTAKNKIRVEKLCENAHIFARSPIKILIFISAYVIIKEVLQGRYDMAITYRKLWKLLIDRKIKKGELQKDLRPYRALRLRKEVCAPICPQVPCRMV